MIIRKLKKEDFEAVKNIYVIHWDTEFQEKLLQRLTGHIDHSKDVLEQKFEYFVAEENEQVLGVVSIRKVPEHMKEFASTTNPAELYVLAVKNKQKGIGKALVEKVISETKNAGYTELVLYSGEIHSESWGFYDHLGFRRVASTQAPNGEPGVIWQMKL